MQLIRTILYVQTFHQFKLMIFIKQTRFRMILIGVRWRGIGIIWNIFIKILCYTVLAETTSIIGYTL